MSKKTRVDQETPDGSAETLEDAINATDAIAYCGEGLHAIARAIEKLALAMSDGGDMEEKIEGTYLDGTPRK